MKDAPLVIIGMLFGLMLGVLAMIAVEPEPAWKPPRLDSRFLAAINDHLDLQTEGTLGLDVCGTCEGRGDKACGECSGAGYSIHGIAPEGDRPAPSWYSHATAPAPTVEPTPQAEIDANHARGEGMFDEATWKLIKETGGTGYQGYWDNKTGTFHSAPGYDGPVPEQPPPLPNIAD